MCRSRRSGKSGVAANTAVSRLKVVLAHDRTGLDEATMTKIREEIQDVVAKYVDIQKDDVEFNMLNDEEVTLMTATFTLASGRKIALSAGGSKGGSDEEEMAA